MSLVEIGPRAGGNRTKFGHSVVGGRAEECGPDRLGVHIIDDRDLVVSCPDSGLSITFRKDGFAPMLVGIDGIDRSSEPSKVKFWAQAWKAAYRKARALGWLRS